MESGAHRDPGRSGFPWRRAGCVALVASLLASIGMTAPVFLSMGYKAKRAELAANLDGIKTAQIAYEAIFDRYLPCGSRALAEAWIRDAPKSQREWDPDALGGDCWRDLGWAPDGYVRGAYWIEVGSDDGGFTVWGISDMDGDGVPAIFLATLELSPRPVQEDPDAM